ncbi:MAG: hypothetical protein GX567_14845 [Clostridia bacterium]|nr:hypothetical protein [Clostridia bacterium]
MTFENIKKLNLSEYYYILVMIGYTLTLATDKMHPGVFATILLLGVALELLLKRRISINTTLDYLVGAYFIYNLLSIIWLLDSGLPATIYFEEFVCSILPIIFYMVGKTAAERTAAFYRLFIIAVVFVCTVGLILYITAPTFYLDYLFKLQHISDTYASTMRLRLVSVIGSTVLGYLAVCAMLACAYFIKAEKKKAANIICFFLNMLCAFMSNQRSAMVVAILVFIYMNYLIFFVFKMMKKKYLLMELGAMVLAFIALCVVYMDAVMKIYYRLVSLPGAIGQRSEQWVVAMNTLHSTWLGNGLGANGHKALGYEGANVIADGGLVKLFCEEGVIGFSILVFILLLAYRKGIQELEQYYVEIGIISIALLQSIGSNILAFQLATPIFWFAIGRIASGMMKKDTNEVHT